MEGQKQNVFVLGAWHLGAVVAARLSEVGHQVTLWDERSEISASWQSGTPPLFEPGLSKVIEESWGSRLFWWDERDIKPDWIIIAYDTPVDEQDNVDVSLVQQGFIDILKLASKKVNLLTTSQLPVGTSRQLCERLVEVVPGWSGSFYHQPENLRLGDALRSIREPERIALGINRLPTEATVVEKSFRELFGLPFSVPVDLMSLESAEMVKHALNSFLATCVVFANELSEICELTGADAWDVAASLRKDARLSPKTPLLPGLGFAGGTLARDVRILGNLGEKIKRQSFFQRLYEFNQLRDSWVERVLIKRVGSLTGKKLVLLGVTYKPNTSTVRRSPAIALSRILAERGAHCVALDPRADFSELSPSERDGLSFVLESDPEIAFSDADAAILVTEWREFLDFPWRKICDLMKSRVVIDTKNFLSSLPLDQFERFVPGKP